MNVLYGKANTLTLPYSLDGVSRSFTFVPGKNEIRPEIWKAICLQHKDRFGVCYSRYLKVFQPSKVENIEFGKTDSIVHVELGEEIIDFSSLTSSAAIELAENTMEPDELKGYLEIEKGQKKPRKTIIKVIEAKIEEIEQFDAKREEGN